MSARSRILFEQQPVEFVAHEHVESGDRLVEKGYRDFDASAIMIVTADSIPFDRFAIRLPSSSSNSPISCFAYSLSQYEV